MSNALRILAALDAKLNASVDLTLYGRAALQLGFKDPPEEFATSLDVDAVFWSGQAQILSQVTNFWQAVEEVNQELSETGLYISHFFQEDQVILTPQWKLNRVAISGPWRHLQLFRLHERDLVLSKLMRDDPLDHQDALFIVDRAGWSVEDVRSLLVQARIPDLSELRQQFELATNRLLHSLEKR